MLSIIHLAELLNLYPGDRLFFEAFPIDKYKCGIRFADEQDSTLAHFIFDRSFQDMIFIWSGEEVDIPDDWVLCDGTHGTPDLRNLFIVCAGWMFPVDDTGGSASHTHPFGGTGHYHIVLPGSDIAPGTDFDIVTDSLYVEGTTDAKSGLPPYYALAFIMNKGWDV